MAKLNEFTKQYQVQKTLRFELIPQGKTQEHITTKGFLVEDEQRDKNYLKVKDVIDDLHKNFMENTLQKVECEWDKLAEAIIEYRRNKNDANKKKLAKQQEANRKEIINWFIGKSGSNQFKEKQKEYFDKLFKEKLFSEILQDPKLGLDAETKEAVNSFNRFTTYFLAFHENRKNMYSSEEKSTSLAYRLVNDNFPKFLSNCESFVVLKEVCPDVIAEAEYELRSAEIYKDLNLAEIFTIAAYNNFLSQSKIDYYNQIIGGIAGEEGTKKIRGINEVLNNALQQNSELKNALRNKQVTMVPLFKQILSDRSTFSFVAEQFENDKDVLEAVKRFNDQIESHEVLPGLKNLFEDFTDYDLNKIYVSSKELSNVSNLLTKQWNKIREAIRESKIAELGNNPSKKKLADIDRLIKNEDFKISELMQYDSKFLDKDNNSVSILQLADVVLTSIEQTDALLRKEIPSDLRTVENKSTIKNLLDNYESLLHLLAVFKVSPDSELDFAFYAELERNYGLISDVMPLYNKVRNYVTKKPYSVEKFKLNFSIPSLASGWDKNKERENGAVIFLKDGKYYLGIMDKNNNKIFASDTLPSDGECYEKLVYKQIAMPTGVGGFIRKCFNSAQKIGWVCPEDCLNEDGKIIIRNDEAKDNLAEIIDCQKNFFAIYEKDGFKYRDYNFKFKSSDAYETLNEFYQDVEMQSYMIKFTPVSVKYIEELVDNGQLYLFQIYNKDFAQGATGNPNLHTMYWNAAFSADNIEDVVVKLNGGAELFYRPKSNITKTEHKVGEKLVNRKNSNGEPIADSVYKELFAYANGKLKESELSFATKKELPLAIIKDVKHTITKDRRYLSDKYFFHVPITLNYKSTASPIRFNNEVQNFLKNNPDINIIGIDRGERNLLYVTVIDQKGSIIDKKQVSYNKIGGYNYHAKLDQREKERIEAKQAWDVVGKIKELKEGYLSLVVKEIADMMIKYNAIVVMENLNVGFKRVRGGIAEKAVYQKFEKMLIDKLNYLVFKNVGAKEPGGVLNAYQLTDKFESFEKIGHQCGFLFYVPAAYTSKIDPATGFANVLSTKHITNIEAKKDFIFSFDSLTYDINSDKFILECDFSNFKVVANTHIKKWKIVVGGKRIIYDSKNKTYIERYPSEELKSLLNEHGVNFASGDILDALKALAENNKAFDLFNGIYWVIINTLQMRNSNAQTGEDYIISAVSDKDGKVFDSRTCGDELPKDADANGAYHIALKGLYLLQKINATQDGEQIKLAISNEEWFEFVQAKAYAN